MESWDNIPVENGDETSIKELIDYIYRNYTKCRKCQSTSIKRVFEEENVILIQCENCGDGVGFDDSTSPDALPALVLELYKKGCLQVPINCCENTDPDMIQIEGFDGTLLVRCLKCNSRSSLGESILQKSEEVPDEVPQRGLCECGNNDLMKMSVYTTRDEIPSSYVTCDLCKDFIQFPEVVTSESKSNDCNVSEYISCQCHPDYKKIKVTKDSKGDVEMVACANCNFFHLPKDNNLKMKSKKKTQHYRRGRTTPWTEHLKSGSESSFSYLHPSSKPRKPKEQPHKPKEQPRYSEVRQLTDLCRGDHIKWDRPKGYSHHAIVEHVLLEPGRISVVHYNGPIPGGATNIKGKIVADTLDPFAEGEGRLFVAKYVNPFPPEEVLSRAYSKIGEVQYNIVSNNCEHFATWCKTGHHISSQVVTVKDLFLKYAGAVATVAMAGKGKGKAVRGFYTVGLMALTEIVSCYKDIGTANEDRREGRLTRDGYREAVGKRIGRSVGGLAGMAGGLALEMCIPTGGILGSIGGTLGGMIGEFLGKHVGSVAVKIQDGRKSFCKKFF